MLYKQNQDKLFCNLTGHLTVTLHITENTVPQLYTGTEKFLMMYFNVR